MTTERPATANEDASSFGYAATCASLDEVMRLLHRVYGDARAATAAYGMVLAARSAPHGVYRDDGLEMLNQLARAKAELDIAALHLRPVVNVTAEILLAAQVFADEAMIPCTEWATTQEIAEVVLREARRFAFPVEDVGDPPAGAAPAQQPPPSAA